MVAMCGRDGHFELNVVTIPLIAHARCIEAVQVLGNAARVFAERCVQGLRSGRSTLPGIGRKIAHAGDRAESIYPGYDAAARVAKRKRIRAGELSVKWSWRKS